MKVLRLVAMVAAVAMAVGAGVPMRAQPFYIWTFNELKAKSDFVAVAAATTNEDTAFRTTLNSMPMIEVRTDFRVLTVMKGDPSTATFSLRHYRIDLQALGGGVLNGGSQLDFGATSRAARQCAQGVTPAPTGNRCEYLMFLMRDADGRFIPTSGQLFSSSSVFELQDAMLAVRR